METETPTPTATPTETPTPTPTLNYYVELETPGGEAARVSREINVADLTMILLLLAILVSVWLMYFSIRLKGGK